MRILISLLAVLVLSGAAGAADMFIYPQKDQTKEQQQADEFACYKWAKEQTGFDPMAARKDRNTIAPSPPAWKRAATRSSRESDRKNVVD
jgi:hypothetical protein